ncbi:MAG: hypothetical protein AAGG51_16975 [Cyanobacteria bacterium P01_G01_bin.54]
MDAAILMRFNGSRLIPVLQPFCLGLLLTMGGNLGLESSQTHLLYSLPQAIAQTLPPDDLTPSDSRSEPETPTTTSPDANPNEPDPNVPDVGAIGEAENIEDLSPDLRPAANTGDLIGDFFSVSVTACTLNPELLDNKTPQELAALGIASAGFISQTTPANPSLWWARDRFGQNDLVQNWLIDTPARQMNLIVDRARWSTLNYVQQYRVVHQFGTLARQAGYELRIFNPQPKCLAVYHCEAIEPQTDAQPIDSQPKVTQPTTGQNDESPACKVDMQPSRRDPFNFF